MSNAQNRFSGILVLKSLFLRDPPSCIASYFNSPATNRPVSLAFAAFLLLFSFNSITICLWSIAFPFTRPFKYFSLFHYRYLRQLSSWRALENENPQFLSFFHEVLIFMALSSSSDYRIYRIRFFLHEKRKNKNAYNFRI